TATGILGNVTILFYYLIINCGKSTLKPIDFILMNIIASNALSILSAGVPQTMAVWGFKQFLNDFQCKIILYIQVYSRSVSVGTTCLLSIFQTMTISPKKSWWKDHKVKVEKHIGCHIFLLWILYMFINFIYLANTFVNKNSKNVTRKRDFEYCSTAGQDEISYSLYAALVVGPEVLLSSLMAWSSRSMIIILNRHKQCVQHIRSTHGSRRNSPESRITQNILILVSTFLTFYTLSSIIRGFIVLLYNHSWWL
ncbi:vomeronasal type-1 receptor 4-like, partial [Sigmodon hispidus]